jgi:hypothetical protein
MSEHLTMGEVTRWMRNLETRMGAMHGENRDGIAEIKATTARLEELQRVQNGSVATVTARVAVLETKQAHTDDEVDRIQTIATNAASIAAKGAMEDISPSVKRLITVGAMAAGAVGGGLVGIAKVIEVVGTLWR